jgi:hypothetical protein
MERTMFLENRKAAICALLVTSALSSVGCGGGGSSSQLRMGTTVTVNFPDAAPAAAAEQIGAGMWTVASLQGKELTLTIPPNETRYGIAYVCPPIGAHDSESVVLATTQDSAPVGICPVISSPSKGAVTGSVDVSAIPGASSVAIYGPLGSVTVANLTGAFNFQVNQGTDDIVFVALDASQQILAVKILPSQTVPGAVNGGMTVVLAPAQETTYQTISVTNVPAGFIGLQTTGDYETANGTIFPIAIPGSQYAVVPVSETQAGNKYEFSATDAEVQLPPNSGLQSVAARLSTASASTGVTLPLPAPLPYSPPVPAKFPSFDIGYTGFAGNSDVNYSVGLNWVLAGGSGTSLRVEATSAYQNGATTLAVPDLTSLTGFLAAPGSGARVSWSAGVIEFAAPPADSSAAVANAGSYIAP